MNEMVKERLTKYLDSLESTVDIMSGEIPLYLYEVVNWMFYSSLFYALLSLLILLAMSYPTYMAIVWSQKPENNPSNEPPACLFVPIGMFLVLALPTIVFVKETTNVIKCAVAPRVVIVEHLRDMNK